MKSLVRKINTTRILWIFMDLMIFTDLMDLADLVDLVDLEHDKVYVQDPMDLRE